MNYVNATYVKLLFCGCTYKSDPLIGKSHGPLTVFHFKVDLDPAIKTDLKER